MALEPGQQDAFLRTVDFLDRWEAGDSACEGAPDSTSLDSDSSDERAVSQLVLHTHLKDDIRSRELQLCQGEADASACENVLGGGSAEPAAASAAEQLVSQAEEPDPSAMAEVASDHQKAAKVEGKRPQADAPPPEPAGSEGLYEVEHRFVFLRAQPSVRSGSGGTIIRGMRLYGTPFQVGGAVWIKLSLQVLPPPAWLLVSEEDSYWAMVDASSTDLGLGILLRRVADGGPAKDHARCPNGHMMHPYRSSGEIYCDMCGRVVSGGNELWGCQKCDYDRCPRCKDRRLPADSEELAVAARGLARTTSWRQRRSAENVLAHTAVWGGKGLADGVMGALAPQLGHKNWRVRAAAERVLKQRLPKASDAEVQAVAFTEQAPLAGSTSRRGCGGLGAMLRAAATVELPAGSAARTVLATCTKGVLTQGGADGPTKEAAMDLWGHLGGISYFDRYVFSVSKEDPDPHVRMAAVSASAKAVLSTKGVGSGDVVVVDNFLAERLQKDADAEVRCEALRGILAMNAVQGLGAASVSKWSLPAFEDRSVVVRRQAAEAMRSLSCAGPFKNPKQLLASKDWWVWQNTVDKFLEGFRAYEDWDLFLAVAEFAAAADRDGLTHRPGDISRVEHARRLLLFQDFDRLDRRLGLDHNNAGMSTIIRLLCHCDAEVAQDTLKLLSAHVKKGGLSAAISALEKTVLFKLRAAFHEARSEPPKKHSRLVLRRWGSPAARGLLPWLKDPHWRMRDAAMQVLGCLVVNEVAAEASAAAEVVPLLLTRFLPGDGPDVTLAVVEVLAHLSERNKGDHAAVLPVCFEDPSPALQKAAVNALARAAANGGVTPAAVEVIASRIALGDEHSRAPACKAMRMVMEARSGSLLTVGLAAVAEWLPHAKSSAARAGLASVLSVGTQGGIGSDGVQLLSGILKSETDVGVRLSVLDALAHGAHSSDHSARMVLRRCVDTDVDPHVRSRSKTALETLEWRASEAATSLQTVAIGGICRGAPESACADRFGGRNDARRRRADGAAGSIRELIPRRRHFMKEEDTPESLAWLIHRCGWSRGHCLWHSSVDVCPAELRDEIAEFSSFEYIL